MKYPKGMRTVGRLGLVNASLLVGLVLLVGLAIWPTAGRSYPSSTWEVVWHFLPLILVLASIATVYTLLAELRWLLVKEQIRYLEAEIWNEAGPELEDYKSAFAQYEQLVGDYDHTFGHRRIMTDGISPSWANSRYCAELRALRVKLRDAADHVQSVDEARAATLDFARAITLLTEDLNERYSVKFLRIISWFSRPREKELELVHGAITKFNAAADRLVRQPSYEAGREACALSRTAGALVHGHWPEISKRECYAEILTDFAWNLESAQVQVERLCAPGGNVPAYRKPALWLYRASMSRRLIALRKLCQNDFRGVHDLLCQAIVSAKDRGGEAPDDAGVQNLNQTAE